MTEKFFKKYPHIDVAGQTMKDDDQLQATVEDISFAIDDQNKMRRAQAKKVGGYDAEGHRRTQIVENLRGFMVDALETKETTEKLRADGYTQLTAHSVEEARRVAETKGLNPQKVKRSSNGKYWLPPFEH